MPVVRVDDLDIAFERLGSGPPLVLLHGILTDARSWGDSADRLADAFTVIAWDAPGNGASSDPPSGFSMADHAAALERFLEVIGVDRPHVLGLSWGSTIALELAHRRPDLPRSLILVGGYAGWAGSLPPDVVAERLSGALDGMASMDPDAYVATWLPTLFAPGADPATVAWCAAIMADFHPDAAADGLRAMARADLRPDLPAIRCPTLIVRGALDVRSTAAVSAALAEAIPAARSTVIPAAGHMCHLDAPDAFDVAVRSFLADVA